MAKPATFLYLATSIILYATMAQPIKSNNNWPNSSYPSPFWKNTPYSSQWSPPTSQNQNWQPNWQRSANQPMGIVPLPQPTLPTPYTLQKNPQPNIQPQLPVQPNLNPNNKLIQSVQIIESPDSEVELRECNELKLRSGHVIAPDEDKDMQPEVK